MDKNTQNQKSRPQYFEETLALPLDDKGKAVHVVPKKIGTKPISYSVTELEKEYFLSNVIRKHRGTKYKMLGKLVSGGMGSIFRILDNNLQRKVAMKAILPGLKKEEGILKSFITEAKITALLEHPNIIPVHEIGLSQEIGLYFTMKLAKGEPLDKILEEIKLGNPVYIEKYNIYSLLNIFRKACDAIRFAHSTDIIHQDIKPQNIMVGEYGEVLVMDWGLAKYIGEHHHVNKLITDDFLQDIIEFSKVKENMIKGSPPFMAPEQVQGDLGVIDKRTDIFLLGATLYHMLTLEPPYQGNTIQEILYKAEMRDLIAPEKRNPDIQLPQELCRIIMKAMSLSHEDRYQSVEELSKDIDDLLAGKWKQQDKKVFNTGDLLMVEGEQGDEAYLIIYGKVQVFKVKNGRKIVLGTLKEGDIVGEMALINQDRRSASVVALEPTEVAILTKHLLSQNLKKIPPYIEKIVSNITARLQEANERIHPFATTDCTFVVLKHLLLIFKAAARGGESRMTIKKIEDQISTDLGIPVQNVKEILLKAMNLKLLVRRSDYLLIPDYNELNQFIELAKTFTKQQGKTPALSKS